MADFDNSFGSGDITVGVNFNELKRWGATTIVDQRRILDGGGNPVTDMGEVVTDGGETVYDPVEVASARTILDIDQDGNPDRRISEGGGTIVTEDADSINVGVDTTGDGEYDSVTVIPKP